MSVGILVPQLVELAVEEVTQRLRQGLNENVDLVRDKYKGAGNDAATINLPHVPVDRYYETEAVEPLVLPAVFVVPDRSEHDLTSAQNVAHQVHRVLVSLLASDVEARRLTRMAWRYAAAMWLTLHDSGQGVGGMAPTCHVLVRSVDYSPLYKSRGAADPSGQRAFRKDVTLTLDVHQYEAFQGYPH